MARYSEQQKAALDALMKENVYEKAIAIMAGEDLQELTMERLAEEVGVSRGTLYNYFADRDAVIDFVADRTFEPLQADFEDVIASDLEAEEQLSKMIEVLFETVYRDRAAVVALVPAKQAGGCQERKKERHAGFVSLLEGVIRKGIESGVFRDLDAALAAELFSAGARGIIDIMVERGEFHPPEKLVTIFKEFFIGGLRNPAVAGSASA